MAKITPFKLNRNRKLSQSVENPPTAGEQLARLREQLEAVERLAEGQASQKQLPAFMMFETALKEQLDAVGRATTELFLSLAEERVSASSNGSIELWQGACFGRRRRHRRAI